MARSFLLPLVGCFGQPVAENPTQVMVEAGFTSLGLDWRYVTTEVAPDGLADAVAGARAMGFVGFNCTIPHKVAVIDHLDGLGESARMMQAVNCVVRNGDRLIGENTDGRGFVEAVLRRRSLDGAVVTMFGAGGAARAIAIELGLAGIAQLTIINRGLERALALRDLIEHELPTLDVDVVGGYDDLPSLAHTDLLVNATSVGLFPDVDARLPVDLTPLPASAIVADVVFNPPTTRLLADARGHGLEAIDGLEMLVGQGVIGVELWTGRRPDAIAMRQALSEALAIG